MESKNKEVVKILFKLLRYELCGGDFNVEKTTLSDEVLLNLLELSKFYDLAHLIGDALNKNGLLENNTQIKSKFLKEVFMAVSRHEQRAYEYLKIKEALSQAKIPFIPLKGMVIQNLYPKPWMRTSSDIDILVDKSNLKKAIEVLKTGLNYTGSFIGKHDAQLYSQNGGHLELHYTLTGGDTTNQQQEALKNVWAFDESSESFERKMSKEHFYLYFILHMAIHVKEGGCGIRPFLDVYLMQQSGAFDKEKCESLLKETNLYTFNKEVEHLYKVWLLDEDYTSLDKDFENYILLGGLYGTTRNRVLVKTQKSGKFKYVLSRIFIPYSELKIMYPKLKKCWILFPFYQIKRWFNLLNKEKRKKAKSELKITINQSNESAENIKNLLNQLEI